MRIDQDVFDAFLAGELDSTLEGPQEALDLWQVLAKDATARQNYDKVMHALRELAGVQPTADGRAVAEAETDALWPLIWGTVVQDTRTRSGLSKQALRHFATPTLVGSICAAIRNMNTSQTGAVVTLDVPDTGSEEEFEISIAKVDHAVSLRLFKTGGMDVHCRVEGDAVTASNVDTAEVENWRGITQALQELSKATAEILSNDTLLNGHVTLSNGRAKVELQPLLAKRK